MKKSILNILKTKYFYSVLFLLIFISCKTIDKEKEEHIKFLDSLDIANKKSITDNPYLFNKAYISPTDSIVGVGADMKKDHRFFGYEKPDTTSKRVILFSIFTSDVDGNPFDMELGSHYDTNSIEDFTLKFLSDDGQFSKIEAIGKNQIIYIENKWIQFSETYEENDDELQQHGIIESIEDGVYPMFIVKVNFPKINYKTDFNLNIESISLNIADLEEMKGSYANIYYTSDEENNLSDIYYNGKSLSGEYAPELNKNFKKITGILSGVNSLSGDLPSKIYVTDSEGKKTEFKWFIDEDILKLNQKTVTVFYSTKYSKNITRIE